jgi:hypothetical protein
LLDAMLAKDPARRLADGAAARDALDHLEPIADGVRRDSQTLVDARTVKGPAVEQHCVVIGARGPTDDIRDPPAPDELARLRAAARAHGGIVELLATGGVVGHFVGAAADIARRAAAFADDARRVLAGWTVVVSAVEGDVAAAADHGTAEHAAAAVSAIFDRT